MSVVVQDVGVLTFSCYPWKSLHKCIQLSKLLDWRGNGDGPQNTLIVQRLMGTLGGLENNCFVSSEDTMFECSLVTPSRRQFRILVLFFFSTVLFLYMGVAILASL